jgi:hypothetical protein
VPATEAELLKDALRFGAATDGEFIETQKLGGQRVLRGKDKDISDQQAIGVAVMDARGKRRRRVRKAELLGRGFTYNPTNTFGEPYWWGWLFRHPDLDPESAFFIGEPSWWADANPRYSEQERRWVLYCLKFRNRNWSEVEGRKAEARGLEIATILSCERRDVQWVASWLRDGWEVVPPRSKRRITAAQVESAKRRLKALGLLKQIGEKVRIQ